MARENNKKERSEKRVMKKKLVRVRVSVSFECASLEIIFYWLGRMLKVKESVPESDIFFSVPGKENKSEE